MKVSHIENQIDEQTSHMDFIASAVENLMSVGTSNISSHRVKTRRNALKESWLKFSINHDAINVATRQLDSREKQSLLKNLYLKENMFKATQEGYLEALEKMSSLLDRIRENRIRSPSVQSGSQTSGFTAMLGYGPRLPQLTLPTFDGSPSEWLPFKDLFDSMVISNANLSPVWKLHYLKQSLKGTAAHLLKNTALTTDNFQKACDFLVSFYENKHLLVNTALHSLLTIKRMTKESATELESLYTTITQIYRTLETLGRPVHTWDDILVFVAVQRLDSESVKAWEHHLGSSKEPPTWKHISEFLMTRLLTLQAVEKSRRPGFQSNQQSVKAHLISGDQATSSWSKCGICSSDHYAGNCPEYANQSIQRRLDMINKNNLCFNCLGLHRVSACRSTRRCNKCGKKHHSTIHKGNSTDKSEPSTSDSSVQVNFVAVNQISSPHRTLLATVQLIVISNRGDRMKVRALIDPGSQISLITEKLAQCLHLPRQQSSLKVKGVGAVKAGQTRGSVSVKLKSHFKSSSECIITAHILRQLTEKFLVIDTSNVNWPHLEGLQFADPDFQSPGHVDVIIGADYYGQVIEEGLRKGSANSPTAQATIFGWVLFGQSETCPPLSEVQSYHISIDEELSEVLQRFWKLEEMPATSRIALSIEDQECEDHFKITHSRDNIGRYIVRLPHKKSAEHLGDSKTTALRMLLRLLKKLQADTSLQKAY